jgi:hypothetical protein
MSPFVVCRNLSRIQFSPNSANTALRAFSRGVARDAHSASSPSSCRYLTQLACFQHRSPARKPHALTNRSRSAKPKRSRAGRELANLGRRMFPGFSPQRLAARDRNAVRVQISREDEAVAAPDAACWLDTTVFHSAFQWMPPADAGAGFMGSRLMSLFVVCRNLSKIQFSPNSENTASRRSSGNYARDVPSHR